MPELLSKIKSPADLQGLTDAQLDRVAKDIRAELVRVLGLRTAHFASNLGVVELCLALHLTYDFSKDRLIWDTGHQVYPHKLITGRFDEFDTIRTRGGLMGFPNPAESDYDLFMTGHAGASVSTVSGLKAGDDLLGRPERKAVAVIGDGAFPCGMVYEAFNNIGGLDQNVLVVLNDNKMSICPRTGGLANYLDQCRATGLYQGGKRTLNEFLKQIPLVGEAARTSLESLRDGLKAVFKNGMLFEELGFRYFGPVDGHDLHGLRKVLKLLKDQSGPVLLHVLTTKGEGVPQAAEDPVTFHAPPVFETFGPLGEILSMRKGGAKAYTDAMAAAIHKVLGEDKSAVVLTAAMCQGNKLEKVRADFPKQFVDAGICESHAVAFAAGMAKAGAKPIVNIYSTFLQRAFDNIFQEVALQNLPVVFTLDRAGLAGPDGPTHHGAFDVPYLRLFPNMTCLAPGDELDVEPMLRFALAHNGPTTIRYPKANLERLDRTESWRPARADRTRQGGSRRVGRGRLLRELRRVRAALPGGGPPAARRGAVGGGHQRPLRQAARPGHDLQGHRDAAAGRDRRGRDTGRRLRQRGPRSGERGGAGHAQRRPPRAARPLRRTRRAGGTARRGRPRPGRADGSDAQRSHDGRADAARAERRVVPHLCSVGQALLPVSVDFADRQECLSHWDKPNSEAR